MQCSDWELAASLLKFPTWYLVKDKSSPDYYCSIWQWLGDDQLPVYLGGLYKEKVRFPHGYDVEPDEM